MIILDKNLYKKILAHSINCIPEEACGLIAGIKQDGEKKVKEVFILENKDHSPEHFSMDPKEQFEVIKKVRNNGWMLLGNFHSHPASPARPSEEDKRLAFDPTISYLILSLQDSSNLVLKSFEIKEGNVKEEEIKIV